MKEQPLVEEMMKIGCLPDDFLTKKETLTKSQLIAFLKAHDLVAECKASLSQSLGHLQSGLNSSNVSSNLLVDYLLLQLPQILTIGIVAPANAAQDPAVVLEACHVDQNNT